MTLDRTRVTVALLAAQAFWFGVGDAFLVIPANGIFLSAYGAEWLPYTYIGIAALGTVASLLIARALRRWTLPVVSVAVLAAQAALLALTWAIIAATGSAWPSIVQLVMFPIVIQLGFVILGGQAGRLLDLQQIKGYFPKIVGGFVLGFMLGGFACAPLLELLGDAEHLVLLAALATVVFLVLVRITASRRPAELTVVDQPAEGEPRPPLRTLLAARFVVLVFAYQVLSAMGSQVLDFLAFDRAAARYPDETELTRFVAVYTGVLNVVDLVFVFVVAGWLLRRFGLRLGLTGNPAVVTVITAGMLAATIGSGAASFAVFAFAATARVVDIALSDGLTRSSVNAVYQVVPVEERMSIQASVEGVGVPVAIGATGVLLIALDLLGLGTSAVIVFAMALCAVWTIAAVVVHRDYLRSLAAALRRRGLDPDAALPVGDEEQSAVRRLLLTDDVRDVRLGLDLAITAELETADLEHLADHDVPDVRLLALVQLARRGHAGARSVATDAARALSASSDPEARRAAALAYADIRPDERTDRLRTLLHDPDVTVRLAALASVGSGDLELVDDVAAGLGDTATVDGAHAALDRLGAPALAWTVDAILNGSLPRPRLLQLVGSITVPAADAPSLLVPLVEHSSQEVSTSALAALARHGANVPSAVLQPVLDDEARLVGRALAAAGSLSDDDVEVVRALDDLVALSRDRVLAVLAVLHGADRVADAHRALMSADPQRRALGVELLQVALPRAEWTLTEPILRDDIDRAERAQLLRSIADPPDLDRLGWLSDMVLDSSGTWRSTWLRTVALHAMATTERAEAAGVAVEIDPGSDAALTEVVQLAIAVA